MNNLHEFFNNLSLPAKVTLDGLSIGAIVAAFLAWLPHIAAGLSILWIGLRMYETSLNIKLALKRLKE